MTPDAAHDFEIELKLELTPEGAEALAGSDIFPGKPKIVQQHATYFDTPDRSLSAAGLSLRIRRSGNKRMQTVKAAGHTAGMFIRPEWEREVDSDEPVIDHATPILALFSEKTSTIAPAFQVENERRVWNVDGVEVALDQGQVLTGPDTLTFSEIELELKDGDPAALFALARRIDEIAPVHLGVLSKAERGYQLLAPNKKRTKAAPVVLTKDMTAQAAFQAIVYTCLRHFRLNVPLVLESGDGAALHQARVALRRLRSALTIFKTMFVDDSARRLNGELRWLAGELGKARDLDVLLDRSGDSALQDRLRDFHTDAYIAAKAALQSDRARALILDVVEWISQGPWQSVAETADIRETPARKFAADVLAKLRRRVKKGGRNLDELDDEARHDLRKAAKKLRYATDFFASLFAEKRERRRHKRFVSALEKVQDRLGALNDLVGTPALLKQVGLADDPQAATLVDPADKAKLLDEAVDDFEALVDAKRFWR